jgi:hypothetical protein
MNYLHHKMISSQDRWVLLDDDGTPVQIGMSEEYALGFLNFIDSIYKGQKQYSIKFDEYYEYHEYKKEN